MLCPSVSIQGSILNQKENCECGMRNCKCMSTLKKKSTTDGPEIPPRPRLSDTNAAWLSEPITRRRQRATQCNPTAVCVTIDRSPSWSDRALASLFASGCRCVHIQLQYGTRPEHERLILKLITAIAAHYLRHPNAMLIATAIEIRGQCVRTGRLHNDKAVQLVAGQRVFVTTDRRYEGASTPDVVYLTNFEPYLGRLRVGDFMFIGPNRIQLAIAKVTRTIRTITCCVLRGDRLESHMDVVLPYLLGSDATALMADERSDVCFAVQNNADFVVVPGVTSAEYVRAIRGAMLEDVAEGAGGQLPAMLCQVDVTAIGSMASATALEEQQQQQQQPQQQSTGSTDDAQLLELLCESDGLWWPRQQKALTRAEGAAVCQARAMRKPIVMAMGRPRQSKEYAFMMYESDCFLLRSFNPYIRSTLLRSVRQRYAAIAQERTTEAAGTNTADNKKAAAATTTTSLVQDMKARMLEKKRPEAVVLECSVFASLLLDAQLIVCVSLDGWTAIRLAHDRPKCPVLAVVERRRLARSLVIYKNVLPVVFRPKQRREEKRVRAVGVRRSEEATADDEDDEDEEQQQQTPLQRVKEMLSFGLERAKEWGIIIVGDLVIYCYDNFGLEESAGSSGCTPHEKTTSYQTTYVPEEIAECEYK